ncbi:Y-family DNA polymerase [Legionella israelensis]|uniref:Y-family DNA polymerase n=1 Tax=Legionella israelensis TaxID=454 RepID=UPI00118125D0|nr:Y-family DNA polymerase [Legionella israelensis]QDP71322.1 Y-family DNA polymerase [Legionella israelensis]
MYALIDCNNFFVSCERLFRPDLRDKPVVVLSSNDGCVIARSNEAKALGIKMGEPYFQVKTLCKRYQLHIFSSNFVLYGDLSRRVMSVIESAWPETEIYSIDEAFLDLRSLPGITPDIFCTDLQRKILKAVGIPVSIGIGPSKTLAKIANHICKKKLKIPVFDISNQREWLKHIDVGEVWGIGRRWHKKLLQRGIYTAYDLSMANAYLLRAGFNVTLQRTAMELQGISCLDTDDISPRKSIMSSRSFAEMQTDFENLAQAVSYHCARACEKLRENHLLAQYLSVFLLTNRFRQDLPHYYNGIELQLTVPTDDVRLLTKRAKEGLKKLFRCGFHYKKVGVRLEQLLSKHHVQLDIFHQRDSIASEKKEQLMMAFDSIKQKYGRHSIKLAAEGYRMSWLGNAALKSPAYTTSWSSLPVVTCRQT